MSFGDKEMIDIIGDVEKYMKEVSAGRVPCKNCLLKIKLKTRDLDVTSNIIQFSILMEYLG
jgi:hypothetical protein